MAVKRNTKITSAVAAIDRRVKSLESTGVSNLGSTTTVVEPDGTPNVTPGNTGVFPPNTFKPVIGARIYGPAATGGFGTRVELYLQDDPELVLNSAGDLRAIQAYGVNGYTAARVEVSSGKTFNPIEVATNNPTWAKNGLRGKLEQDDWRQTPPVAAIPGRTVTHTIWYNPVTQNPDTTDVNGIDLVVTRAIDSASASGSTVTVTFNASSHRFEVGDIIKVDLPAPFDGKFYYGDGPDGLFEITAVGANTITYELDDPVPSPVSYTFVSGQTRRYVYAVVRGFRPEGDIWNDTSVVPARVWVWKKLRWYNTADPIGDVAATKDGILPNPVTNLQAESSVPDDAVAPVIDLTWTPPTSRVDGSDIAPYLDGYEIWYKENTAITWKKTPLVKDGGEGVSSYTIIDSDVLRQNRIFNIRAYTVDIMGQFSTAAATNVLTGTFSDQLNSPSPLVLTSRLGTLTATWDGLDSTGNLPVENALFLEVHRSTTPNFTISDSTAVDVIQIGLGGGYAIFADLEYNTTYYFKSVLVRRKNPFELEKSAPSTEVSSQVTPLVRTDLTVTNVLNSWTFDGELITANALANGSVTASKILGGAVQAEALAANAVTSVALAQGAVTAAAIAADAVTAPAIQASAITAGKIAANAVTAVSIAANSITSAKITAGAIGADQIAAGAIVAGKVSANAIGANEIAAGAIIAGKIGANAVTANTIAANSIEANAIVANAITAAKIEAGAVTGVLLRGDKVVTNVAPNARVELTNVGIYAYTSANVLAFSFNSTNNQLVVGGYATTTTTDSLAAGLNGKINVGGAVADVNAAPTATTINGGKITTGTIDASRITVTDTFRYTSALGTNPAYEVRLGRNAISSHSGVSSGLGFWQSGIQYGYLATWGTGQFELGADFGSAYMTIGLAGLPNNLFTNFANGYDISGTSFRSIAAIEVTRPSTSAFAVRGSSSAGDRVISVDTTTTKLIVGNGVHANTLNTLDVFGRIRATGTITANTSISSIRYKTDIREFSTPIGLLNITPKLYKYDNTVLYETWPDAYSKKVPGYSDDHVGAIAEDFIEIGLGYLVSRDEEGRPEALDYSKISILLIPYIKDLYNKIEELKREN